jgi:hypothetical protein
MIMDGNKDLGDSGDPRISAEACPSLATDMVKVQLKDQFMQRQTGCIGHKSQ